MQRVANVAVASSRRANLLIHSFTHLLPTRLSRRVHSANRCYGFCVVLCDVGVGVVVLG